MINKNTGKVINSSITNTPTLNKTLVLPNGIDKIAFNQDKYNREDVSVCSNSIKKNLFNTNFSKMSINDKNDKNENDGSFSSEINSSQHKNVLSLIFNIENL